MITLNPFDWMVLGVLLVGISIAVVLLHRTYRPRPLVVDVGKAKMAQASRGYDPDARVYPHPWEGKQVRLLRGHPELGIEPGTIGRVDFAYVDDETELHIAIDGHKYPLIMFEHEAGRYFEVLP